MSDIEKHIESVLTDLRDLHYEANCEWEKGGRTDENLLALSGKSSTMLMQFSELIHDTNYSVLARPTEIRLMLSPPSPQKIQAIKTLRSLNGIQDLRETKETIDKADKGWTKINYGAGVNPSEVQCRTATTNFAAAGYEVR